jgi:hypothetical protein
MDNNSNDIQASEIQPGSLPITISLDEFHDGIAEVFFLYVRSIGLMTDDKTAWATNRLFPDHFIQCCAVDFHG